MASKATTRLGGLLALTALGVVVPVAGSLLRAEPRRRLAGPPAGPPKTTAPAAPERVVGHPLAAPAPPPPEPAYYRAEEWSSGEDYVLRVRKARVALPGAAEDGGPDEVELITYNGRPVGPTIRARRGSTVRIKLVNELPDAETPQAPARPDQEEPPHDLYATNLHTHGLHVSPAGDSDNPFRVVAPGESFQYIFTIPADHPAGTFWYHPHKHGAVAYQLGNGLAGALIVEGSSPPGKTRDLEDIPEIAAARERSLVLQPLVLRRHEDGVGWVDPNDVYTEPPYTGTYETTAVNGVVLPAYHMQPGEIQRWRFIHAGRADYLMLRWGTSQGMEMRNMHFGEIAVDGIARGELSRRRCIILYPGNRSDALVQAPETPGTYYLMSIQENEAPAPGEPVFIEKRLVRLVVGGPPRPMRLPTSEQLAACRPFEPINASECTVKREIVFQYDDKKKVFHINGLPFDRQGELDRAVLGTAEEWTLSAAVPAEGSADEPHPFHIHVNPFQVVRIEKVATKVGWEVDEWRDTIAVDWRRKITIRMRFRDFAGKTVYHCHTLDHEDQGMMHAFRIVDPRRPEEGAGPAMELTECLVPAPPLALDDGRGGAWSLAEHGGRPVILVFFRGMQCLHCFQELQDLLRQGERLAGAGAALVAISSRPIADPREALASFDVPAGLDFTLLVDERQRGFRDFGCYDGGPLHGLFVIDPDGAIRARYTGEVPFADPQGVCAQVRRLGPARKR